MAKESSAERTIVDFAPKLVELTDDVLLGDIWERPGLSKRDRGLIREERRTWNTLLNGLGSVTGPS